MTCSKSPQYPHYPHTTNTKEPQKNEHRAPSLCNYLLVCTYLGVLLAEYAEMSTWRHVITALLTQEAIERHIDTGPFDRTKRLVSWTIRFF